MSCPARADHRANEGLLYSGLPCVASDSCNLTTGANTTYGANDGVCDDILSVAYARGIAPTWQYVPSGPPIDLGAQYLAADNRTAQSELTGGVLVLWNASLAAAPNASVVAALLVGAAVPGYLGVPCNGTVATPFNYSASFVYFVSGVVLQPSFLRLLYGIENVTCPAGTDASDCGPSSRVTPLPLPGLTCAVANTLANSPNVTLFDLVVPFAVVNISAQCPFACPFFQCADGTCADDAGGCAVLYDCPGNGCLASDTDEYYCACDNGFSGLVCELDLCDPTSSNPYALCTCGNVPQLKAQPPMSTLFVNFSNPQLAALNRRNLPRNGSSDVQMLYLQADAAPFGVPLKDCPFLVTGPNGEPLTLQQCVLTQNSYGQVLEWTTFVGPDNATHQYVWTDIDEYYEVTAAQSSAPRSADEFPVRCATGQCVANEDECAMWANIQPLCNGLGKCRADSSCECLPGYQTFVITDHFTSFVDWPYDKTNPAAWGNPSTNGVDYGGSWCTQRNCTALDCSPPLGCFQGTLANNFADRFINCPANPSQCGQNLQACVGGNTVPTTMCSGNGIWRKVDYRDEWRCACGEPLSVLQNSTAQVRVITGLTPNGWGGDRCDIYYCDDPATKLFFHVVDPATKQYYRNSQNQVLPGKWTGACDAPIGPDPDQFSQWNECCPEMLELELCAQVPCVLGGAMQCVPAARCLPMGGVPQVFACNNHGTARKDGTCLCDYDRGTGVGYTADTTRFTTANCYERFACPLDPESGAVCNALPACTNPEFWVVMANLAYLQQQYVTFMYEGGVPVTNATFVRAIDPNFEHVTAMRNEATLQVAIGVQLLEDNLDGCIGVSRGDNCSTLDPVGMRSVVVPPSPTVSPAQAAFLTQQACAIVYQYMKGFATPYDLQDTVANVTYRGADVALLTDDVYFGRSANLVENVHYLVLNLSTDVINISLAEPRKLVYVRIHGSLVAGAANLQVKVADGTACSVIAATASPVGLAFFWQGFGLGVTCITQWVDFDFTLSFKAGYITNCGDPQSAQCTEWQQATCPPPAVVPQGQDYFPGCTQRLCCSISVQGPTGFYPWFTIGVVPSAAGAAGAAGAAVWVDEVRVMGYSATVLPRPPVFDAFIKTTVMDSNCSDEDFYEIAGIQDQSLFASASRGEGKAPWNATLCEDNGGWKAIALSQALGQGQDPNALAMAAACNSTNHMCWVGAKNRDDLPDPPLDTLLDSRCTNYGCYIAQPTQFTDVYASNKSHASQYVAASPTLSPWVDFVAGVHGQPNGQVRMSAGNIDGIAAANQLAYFTGTHACKVDLYSDPLCGSQLVCSNMYCDNFAHMWFPLTLQASGISAATDYLKTVPTQPGVYSEFCAVPYGDAFDTTIINHNCGGNGNIGHAGVAGTAMPFYRCVFPNCPQAGAGTCPSEPTDDGCDMEDATSFQQSLNFGPNLRDNIVSIGITGDCQVQLQTTSTLAPTLTMSTTVPPSLPLGIAAYNTIARTPTLDKAQYRYPDMCVTFDSINGNPLWQVTAIKLAYQQDIYGVSMNVRAPASTQPNPRAMDYSNYPFMCANVDFNSLIKFPAGGGIVQPGQQTLRNLTDGPVQLTSSALALFTSPSFSPAEFPSMISPCPTFIQCQQCEIPQGLSFQWDAHILPTLDNAFPELMNFQPTPVLWVNWSTYTGVNQNFQKLQSIASPPDYAWENCNQREGAYHIDYDVDNCVLVSTLTQDFANDLCSAHHDFVCDYDINKYTVQAGRQLEECGTNARSGPLPAHPNETCFDLFPVPAPGDPDYTIYLSWLAGNLTQLTDLTDIDYDAVYAFIANSSTVLPLLAYPGFIQCLAGRLSTRATTLYPPGTTAQPNWVDCNIPGLFPVTCPDLQCNTTSGVCRRRCAAAPQYCSPQNAQYAGQPMPLQSMPAFLQPLPESTNFTTTLQCGTLIPVSAYATSDAFGSAMLAPGLRLLTAPAGSAKFQTTGSAAFWGNVFKVFYQFVAGRATWASGTVAVSPCVTCAPWMALYVSPTSVTGNTSLGVLVANISLTLITTQYVANFTAPAGRALLFSFGGLRPGFTITLSDALVTDTNSIATCAGRDFSRNWVEPQSSTDSGAPLNMCIMTDDDVRIFAAPRKGGCMCGKSFSGTSCSYPSLPLRYAPGRVALKATCGGFGTGGAAALPGGGTTPVLEDGAYLSGSDKLCKWQDPARIISTAFRLDSAYSDEYVDRNDAPVGAQPFFAVPVYQLINYPLPTGLAIDQCAAQGAALPSWLTADQVTYLVGLATAPAVADLNVSSDGTVVWPQANTVMANVTVTAISGCGPPNICATINYNNLAYGQDGLVTDGDLVTLSGSTAPSFTLNAPVTTSQWTLYVYPAVSSPAAYVAECNPLAVWTVAADWWSMACTTNTTTFTLNSNTASIAEVRVFVDNARV